MSEKKQDKTYVYDGKEVILTGRIASRKSQTKRGKEEYLVEIRPSNAPHNFKDTDKWVNADHLYVVSENTITDVAPQLKDDE